MLLILVIEIEQRVLYMGRRYPKLTVYSSIFVFLLLRDYLNICSLTHIYTPVLLLCGESGVSHHVKLKV